MLNARALALAYSGVLCGLVTQAAWSVDPMAAPTASADLGAELYALSMSIQEDGPRIAAAGDAGGRGRVAVWDGSGGELWVIDDPPAGIGPILCAEWSPSGDVLLFCARDGMAYLYDRDGASVREWAASPAPVLACAFTPDGSLALTAGADGVIRVWDTASGDLAREMTGHEGPVFALDVSPNGTRVASGDAAGVALLWTLGAERPDSAWRAHDNTVSAVTFVGNDRTVATAGWDRRVLLLSEEDGAPVEIDRLPGPALSLDVGADGVTLAAGASTSGEASITFWHVPSRTRVLTLAGAPAQAIAFVEGAHAFTTGVASGDVRVWEARPETPAPIDPEDPRTTTLEWADASALYYEAQVTRTLPVGESDTTLLTRRTSIELPEEFVDGSHVWWRVRSVGFGAVTDWSEPHSIIADGPAASVAQVWVELSPRQAAVGDRVTARVMIDGAIGLAGFELDIVIDPGVLAPLEAAIGDALGGSSQTSWAEPTSTGENGAYALSGAKGARLGGGIHATGALVTVVLAAEKAGQAEVRVRNLSLSSAGAARIDASVASASAAILPAGLPADVTRDGVVDIVDLLSVATFFGRVADDDHMTRVDVDGSGAIDIADLALVARDFGMSIESVAAAGPRLGLNRPLSDVREWMARVGPGDHDMAAWRRLLAVLDAALADGAGGATTPLLAAASAYPNPSNPATWIPFALSRPAHVDVAIYDTRGLRVRSIRLGARDPGDHMRRGSAAYWDGRNDAGDRVSGGLYIARVTATPTAGGPARTEHARIVMSR